MCVHCQPGEPGELVGKISSSQIRKFDGYLGLEESQKKIANNVFRKGDMTFRTGDLLSFNLFSAG